MRASCFLLSCALIALILTTASVAADDLPAFVTQIHPELPKIPDWTGDVRHSGARGDGSTDDTMAIQKAFDEARKAGGGTVEFPAGTYLSGPLKLSSKLRLHLQKGAVLSMLPFAQYPGGTKDPGDLLGGSDLHDVAITGPGSIDGQGAPWWPYAKTKGARRPRMIALNRSTRILIEEVTLQDSPMFHIAIGGASSDVTVRKVIIRAPASTDPTNPSHNTDACDVSGNNILVEDCDVSVGDDNYTCGSNTSNVLLRRNTYGSGHGLSIGSYTRGGVHNFAAIDCTFNGTDCGIRIKSDRDRGGDVHDLFYQNLRMENVNTPILIYGSYMSPEKQYRDLNKLDAKIAASYPSQPVGPLTPRYHNIIFRNITATASPGRRAGLIWGLPEAPAENILFEHVEIKADLPFGLYDVRNMKIEHSKITTPAGGNGIDTYQAEVTYVP